jgi:hypothetical protein
MADAAETRSAGNRIVIVPKDAGPVIEVGDGSRKRSPDEFDELIEDVFGAGTNDPPGPFDALLVIVGGGLVVLAQYRLHSTAVTIIGAALIGLGAILPIRSLWRRSAAARADRRNRALAARGLPLGVTDPLASALVKAYGELLTAADGALLGSDAAAAAHLSMIEVATLVGTSGPGTSAESEYVQRRIDAMQALTAELDRYGQAGAIDADADRKLERTARGLAGAELDATGSSSLRDLDELTRALAPAPDA